SAGLTLLVAAPELGFDAVFLSMQLLDVRFTLVRVAGAAVLAVIIGYGVGRLADKFSPQALATPSPQKQQRGFLGRLREGLGIGFGEIVDHTGPWILLGLALAALAEPFLDVEALRSLPGWLEVSIFALIGMPMYVCASGATPLAAVLIFKGISPGAALAFLMTGPATNMTTFGVLSSLHGTRVALAFGGGMALLAVLFGHTVNAFHLQVDTALQNLEPPGWLHRVCLGALSLVLVLSLLRQGARGFINQVLSAQDDEEGADPHRHDICDTC
ncbi:MAG: permease, partial [Planctomycetota bacterium]